MPFRRTPTLREIAFGQWEGWSWAELLAEHGEWASKYFDGDPTFQAPGGELLADVVERGRKFIHEAELIGSDGDVVVVGHGGALRGLISVAARSAGPGDAQVQPQQRQRDHR